jgi:hypothetical protein
VWIPDCSNPRTWRPALQALAVLLATGGALHLANGQSADRQSLRERVRTDTGPESELHIARMIYGSGGGGGFGTAFGRPWWAIDCY